MNNLMKKAIFGVLFTCIPLFVFAQEEPDEYQPIPYSAYQYPVEPEVLANLREW
jgi:hypothetical protein